MCKISIIIPIYNAEQHIESCINSIISQKFKDWELILINDGSKDNSLAICNSFSKKDQRIRVLTKENGGVSSARNMGLKDIKGEYVTFIDVDDYLSENFFDLFNNENITEDFVFLQYKCFDNKGNISDGENIPPTAPIIGKEKINRYLSEWLHQNIVRVPWGKFIKSNIIKDKLFPIGQTIGEDSVFIFSVLAKAKSIRTIDNIYYMWRTHADDFAQKYQLPTEKSIEFLCNTYNSYRKIEAPSPHLEATLYFTFYILAEKSIGRCKWRWFSRPVIRKLWNSIDYEYKFVHKNKFKKYRIFEFIYRFVDKNKFYLQSNKS